MIRARKRFGQHFLEPAWVQKLVDVIDPKPDETFIEIGPGHGALTFPLAARAKSVLAFEIDRDLAAELRATVPPNVEVIEGDFLEAAREFFRTDDQRPTTNDQRPTALRVAGNLPYNVASPILFELIDLFRKNVPLVDASVMLQREVAERLIAAPGSRDYGVLSLLVGHRATTARLLTLPPGAFRPPPKVRSAAVGLRFHAPQPPVKDEQLFADLIQAVFTRRRKTLSNALAAYSGARGGRRRDGGGTAASGVLDRAGIDGSRRPETLSIEEFARLADVYASL